MADVLYCGYEIRQIKNFTNGRPTKRDISVLHFQSLQGWNWFTMLDSEEGSLADTGRFFSDETLPMDKTKPYRPTRKEAVGMGPVRGYTMTFNPRFGVQLWLFVEMKLGKWTHNVPVLVAEAKVSMHSKQDFLDCWQGHLLALEADFPLNSYQFVGFDAKKRRAILTDTKWVYDIAATFDQSAPEPAVDTAGSAELPASSAG